MVVFRAWISEMMAIIMAEEIARDLPSAELMMTRCKEHKAEIDSRQDAVNKFLDTGKVMIENGHFLSEEVPLNVLFFSVHLRGGQISGILNHITEMKFYKKDVY